MASSPSEDEYLEYYSPSGSVVCRVLYQLGPMVFVQFRTWNWDDFGYKEFGNYARVALFPEHLRPADPLSPGVVGFVHALMREAAGQQQHGTQCRRQAAAATSLEDRRVQQPLLNPGQLQFRCGDLRGFV
jgi:hypothetical protein